MKIIFIAINLLVSLGDFVCFLSNVAILLTKRFSKWQLVKEHFYDMGLQSFPIVGITGIATGLILTTQSYFMLSEKGLTGVTGIMVAKTVVTELAPIFTGFILTGRIGAAISAELGSMQVSNQVDALIAMAIDPIKYLVIPRMISTMILFPLLVIFNDFISIFSGYFMATKVFHISSMDYLAPIPFNVNLFDYFSGIVKSIVFGFFVVAISCYKGMKTKGGAYGVGKNTTSSVVNCYVCILISDFFLTLILNFIK